MPNLKNATQQPDMSSLVQLLSPAPQVMPLIPNQNPAGLPASGSRGPAPSIWTTAYDSVRQWTQPATSQVRFPPLPTKANPQVNAQAASVAKSVAASPSTSGVSVGLDIPNIFTPTTQVVNLPGTLAFGLALEKQGQVFAVPAPPVPNLASLDFTTSLATGVNMTISATANYQDAVFLWAGSNGTITGISSGWSQAGSNPLYYGDALAVAGSSVSATLTTGTNPIVTVTAGILFGFPASAVVVPTFIAGTGGAYGNTPTDWNVTVPSACKTLLLVYSWQTASPNSGNSVSVAAPFPTYTLGIAGDLTYQSVPNLDIGQIVVAAIAVNPPTGVQTFVISTSCGVGQDIGDVVVAAYDITGVSNEAIEGIPQFMYLEPNQIPVGGAYLQAANYTAQVTDSGTVQYWLNNSNNTFYLPTDGPPSTNWFIIAENYGSGILTVNGNGYLINGSASLTADQNQGYMIYVSGPSSYIAIPLGSGGGSAYYQTVQQAGSSETQRAKLNFLAPFTATDDSGNGSTDIAINNFTGDSGSGGAQGAVPAPPAGSAASGYFLSAGGTWAAPSISAYYQTVQQAGSSKPQEAKLNFLAPMTATDDSGNGSTDVAVSVMVGDTGSGGTKGLVPAPGAGTAAAGDYLNAGGTWTLPFSLNSLTGAVTLESTGGTIAVTKPGGLYVNIDVVSATSSQLGAIELNTDLGGTATAPHVVATHLSSPLPINQGGTATTSPAIVAGSGIAVSGSWPNQTISIAGSGVGAGVSGWWVSSSSFAVSNASAAQFPFTTLGLTASQDIIISPVNVPYSISAQHISIYVESSDSTYLYDIGIYNSSGALLGNIGPQKFTSTGLKILTFTQGTVTIGPGQVWFAVTNNGGGSAGMELLYYSGNQVFVIYGSSGYNWFTSSTTASSTTLPSSITLPSLSTSNISYTTSVMYFPFFSLGAF